MTLDKEVGLYFSHHIIIIINCLSKQAGHLFTPYNKITKVSTPKNEIDNPRVRMPTAQHYIVMLRGVS